MESRRHNFQGDFYHKKKRKFFNKKVLIFLSFLFVMITIFVGAFYGKMGITGKITDLAGDDNMAEINAVLSVPEMNFKGEYDEIVLEIYEGHSLILGDKNILFGEFSNKVIIKDFDGTIGFNDKLIHELKGKASEIILNGVPISSTGGKKIKFSLTPETEYGSIEINDNFYLREFDYVTSGEISFDKNSLSVDSERVYFKKYLGSLRAENRKLILNGIVKSLEIRGESRKIILSG